MTTREWQRSNKAAERGTRHLDRRPAPGQRNSALLDWFRLFLLRRRIRAMLRRSVGPVRHEDAATLPPRILRDIGL